MAPAPARVPEAGRLVGVVPAAGLAARLQPIPCSKEVLPVGGRPVIEYVLERMRAAEPSEVRVVTRPDKHDVVEHATRAGARVVLATPRTLAASVACGTSGLEPDDIVLIGLPDSVWEPRDGFRRLHPALDPHTDVVLGLFLSAEPERSDVVSLDEDGRVAAVTAKPRRPQTNLVWGCAAARAAALAGLADVAEPGDLFDELARAGRAGAVCFRTEFIDIGTRESLRRSAALFAEP